MMEVGKKHNFFFLWKGFLNRVVKDIPRQPRHVVILFQQHCVAHQDIPLSHAIIHIVGRAQPNSQQQTLYSCALKYRSIFYQGGNGLPVGGSSLPLKETRGSKKHVLPYFPQLRCVILTVEYILALQRWAYERELWSWAGIRFSVA